jgi:hypothetical protein
VNLPEVLRSNKIPLDTSPQALGELTDSSALAHDGMQLRKQMAQDGYLFLRGILDADQVLNARKNCLEKLEAAGWLEPGTDSSEAIARKSGKGYYFHPELAENNPILLELLYDGPMMALYERFLGAEVDHFDYTWMRAVGPGGSTQPHCDLVYMGRGTHELFTSWTPLGHTDLVLGGLMILENSHQRPDITGEYLKQDVDTYCEGGPGEALIAEGKLHWEHWQKPGEGWCGELSDNPARLREQLGTRWLTAEYSPGDLLIFSMRTIHASIENQSQHIRLSSDTRYQRQGQPLDERWIAGPGGEKPISHSLAAKRGRAC